jgi:hypothetical protein
MVQGILRRGTSGINTTGSSSLNLNLHLGPLASNMTHRLRFMQGYTLAPNGDRLLGNPVNLVVLNKDSKPDCNENGIQDYYEVIVNPGIDLNNNLIPDSCEP